LNHSCAAQVEAFEADGARARVFLLSTKAGNMGINLVAANRVVLFDACWNPAIDRQALFRCFRYGQTKHVYIYRLVAQGFERRVYQRANQKEFLALKVVDDAALERLYDFADLGDVARLGDGGGDDASSVGSDDDGGDAAVEDGALAAALAARGDVVASTVVTDDLMRENEDERLDAGLRDDAMDEYEREKAGRPSREEEARRDAAIRAEQLRRQQAAEEANRARVARELAARRHREALLALPPGWQLYRRESDSKPYYHHAASGQTVWQHPGGWSPGGGAAAPAPAAPAPAPAASHFFAAPAPAAPAPAPTSTAAAPAPSATAPAPAPAPSAMAPAPAPAPTSTAPALAPSFAAPDALATSAPAPVSAPPSAGPGLGRAADAAATM